MIASAACRVTVRSLSLGQAWRAALALAAFAAIVAIRASQTHTGLTYPDGYQYLLMARGLASHGHAYLRLGPHGDVLLPNADAAIKPLQPLLVAVLHLTGVSWLTASRGLSAVSGACAVVLSGMVALRLTGSRPAAAAAAAVMLASPSLAYWSGFSGPDSLAIALALAALLAGLSGRVSIAGALWGLAATARPECAVIAVALLVGSLADRSLRRQAWPAAVAGMLCFTAVFAIARPPLELSWEAMAAAAMAAALGGAALVATRRSTTWPATVSAGTLAVPLAAALVLAGSGARTWAGRDWPLLAVAGAGLALAAVCGGRRRQVALGMTAIGLILYAVYTWKNPGVDRYLAIGLTPLVAQAAGLLVAAVVEMRRVRLAVWAAVAASLVAAASTPIPAASAHDLFGEVAADLSAAHRPAVLVTAAPDAYSYWLPGWSIRVAQPGQTGLVLDDAAFRSLDATLKVCGVRLASYMTAHGFTRADNTVDEGLAMLMRGTVEPDGVACPSGRSSGVMRP